MEIRSTVESSGKKGDAGAGVPEDRPHFRIHYSKGGNLCFIGHRDLIRAMERLIRRAEIPIAMSEGFHPKPRLSYLSVLGLGYSSQDELMDALLTQEISEKDFLQRINAASVEGLIFNSVRRMKPEEFKLRSRAFEYQITIPAEKLESVRQKARDFMTLDSLMVEKINGKSVDVRLSVGKLEINENGIMTLEMIVQEGPEAGVREVLLVLGLEKDLFRSIFPVRTKTIL